MKIPRAQEISAKTQQQVLESLEKIDFPVVMKVVGPLHKSDVGGVVLDIKSQDVLLAHFKEMMQIPDAQGVLIQQQLSGVELFIGVSYEKDFGHLLMMGLGGIFVEVLGDIKVCLCPCTKKEILYRLKNLKGYPLLQGIRGKRGVDLNAFAEIIQKISYLTQIMPEIQELDINPLLGEGKKIFAVDMRLRIKN